MQQPELQWKMADILFVGVVEANTGAEAVYLVKANGKAYSHISPLLHDHPALKQPQGAEIAANILLFLHRGEQDSVITDAGKFKQGYQSRLLQEQLDLSLAPLYRQHPEFDIGRVHPPQWQNNRLNFFFIEHTSRLPYAVSYLCPASQDLSGQKLFNQTLAEDDPGFECRLLTSL